MFENYLRQYGLFFPATNSIFIYNSIYPNKINNDLKCISIIFSQPSHHFYSVYVSFLSAHSENRVKIERKVGKLIHLAYFMNIGKWTRPTYVHICTVGLQYKSEQQSLYVHMESQIPWIQTINQKEPRRLNKRNMLLATRAIQLIYNNPSFSFHKQAIQINYVSFIHGSHKDAHHPYHSDQHLREWTQNGASILYAWYSKGIKW